MPTRAGAATVKPAEESHRMTWGGSTGNWGRERDTGQCYWIAHVNKASMVMALWDDVNSCCKRTERCHFEAISCTAPNHSPTYAYPPTHHTHPITRPHTHWEGWAMGREEGNVPPQPAEGNPVSNESQLPCPSSLELLCYYEKQTKWMKIIKMPR